MGADCLQWGLAIPLGRAHPTRVVVRSAPMSTSIDVVINGQPRAIEEGTTIFVLLDQLGFAERRVAVERNREIVPRAQHATTVIVAGDRLELVTFVGGGS
jgi:sulfur carrier protein